MHLIWPIRNIYITINFFLARTYLKTRIENRLQSHYWVGNSDSVLSTSIRLNSKTTNILTTITNPKKTLHEEEKRGSKRERKINVDAWNRVQKCNFHFNLLFFLVTNLFWIQSNLHFDGLSGIFFYYIIAFSFQA